MKEGTIPKVVQWVRGTDTEPESLLNVLVPFEHTFSKTFPQQFMNSYLEGLEYTYQKMKKDFVKVTF